MHVMEADATGYSGEPTEKEQLKHIDYWDIEEYPSGTRLGQDFQGRLTCDGVVRAIIYFEDEEEFKWLAKRVRGDRTVKRKREES